jgi:Dolichyl-phosphate-mannose-protein mannosyltransferase
MEAGTESQLTALGRKLGGLSVALAVGGGVWMRLWMLKALPQVSPDTLLYGGMAKNMLLHGQYAISDGSGVVHETLLRLPGYPLFLAACFRLFGIDNYNAVCYVQIALELVGCLLLADFVRRIAPQGIKDGAAHCTLWLAALCPFTASYAVAPLTEAPTLFAIALALWALVRFHARPGWVWALTFTFAVTFAALLRPDGALVGVALGPALVLGLWRGGKHASGAKARVVLAGTDVRAEARTLQVANSDGTAEAVPFQSDQSGQFPAARLVRMGVVCVLLALLPFAVWTARNWRVFHVLMPLAPRYATDPGEDVNAGWQRWIKTWCLDFVSTYDVYWNVPGGPLDISKLPARAFDSPQQYAETAALAAAYSDNGQDLSPELDARFGRLAEERIKANPLRYYVWLPLGRMADMWLRPRVENLNIDLDWWVYSHHYSETRFSWAYAGLNAAYLLLALLGLFFRPRYWPWMVLYFVLRSLLLMTIEAPEARYTLECFPMVFALAGIGAAGGYRKIVKRTSARRDAVSTSAR